MGAVLQRDRLAAVLARLESPYDGERAAAGLLASRMVRAAGMSWQDVVTPPAPPATASAPEPMGWRYALAVCRVHQDRLTPWERSFCDQLAAYRHRPSDKQLQVLAGIYCKAAA